MSIVIKEIILSDTLEKFMEKVNFNFDQLMLAGGGPPGPIGPSGPAGPAGPKGDPGNKWYVGCTATEIAIGTTLYEGDLFLNKGTACTAGGTWGPLGQVWEWDDLGNTFSDTGLNLRGPTGPQGASGQNVGWGTYPGFTTGAIFDAGAYGTPGPTGSFTLLRGDTDFIGSNFGTTGIYSMVNGIRSMFSRDILWLGGQDSAQRSNNIYELERLPKIVINPRQRIDKDHFFTNNFATGGGKAGGGITLGWDGPDTVTPPLFAADQSQPYSHSNIFIDTELNLHITNFTSYHDAITNPGLGVQQNDIYLESMRSVYQVASGYGDPTNTAISNLYTGIGNIFDWAIGTTLTNQAVNFRSTGFVVVSKESAANKILLQGSEGTQVQIVGGGGVQADVTVGGGRFPNTVFSQGPSAGGGNNYTIMISNDDLASNENNQLLAGSRPHIQVGGVAEKWLGIGNEIDVTTNIYNPKLFQFNTGAAIVDTPASLDNAWHNLYSEGLDIEGRLRMRETAGATGFVMVQADASGTGEWVSPTEVGQWIVDPLCASRIKIAQDTTYPSTVNAAQTGFSRFDFAINRSSALLPDGPRAYFTNYNNASDTAAYSLGLDYRSDDNQGQFVHYRYTALNDCLAPNNTEPGSNRNITFSTNTKGQITIGDDSQGDGFAVQDNWKLKIAGDNENPAGTFTPGNIQLETLRGDESFSSLLGNFQYPLIQLTRGGDTRTIETGGWNDQINLEFLTDNADLGPSNIRFYGIGDVDTTTTGTPNALNTRDGIGSSGGAFALLASDTVGATSPKGVAGKSPIGFEANHRDMFVSNTRFAYRNNANMDISGPGSGDNLDDNGNPRQQDVYKSQNFRLFQWGDTNGSNLLNTANGFFGVNEARFNGSFAQLGSTEAPARMDSYINNPANDGWSNGTWPGPNYVSSKGYGLFNWISPDSIFSYQPINVSRNNETSSEGLSYINFNINMGYAFWNFLGFTISDASRDWGTGSGDIKGGSILQGPGSFGYGQNGNSDTTYTNTIGTGGGAYTSVKDQLGGLDMPQPRPNESSLKLQTFRIKLSGLAGPAMSDENTAQSRRRIWSLGDGFSGDTQADGDRTDSLFQTEWKTCQVKPISAEDFNSSRGEIWYPGSGSEKWKDLSIPTTNVPDFDTLSLWSNPPSNPSDIFATPEPNLATSMSAFRTVPDLAADYAETYQYATFQWRLTQLRTGPITGDQFVTSTYLDFRYLPDHYSGSRGANKLSYGVLRPLYTSDVPTLNPSLAGYQSPWDGPRWESADMTNMYGLPINTLVLADLENQSTGNKVFSAAAAITNTPRKRPFYESHGLSFSGGAMVKWNKVPASIEQNEEPSGEFGGGFAPAGPEGMPGPPSGTETITSEVTKAWTSLDTNPKNLQITSSSGWRVKSTTPIPSWFSLTPSDDASGINAGSTTNVSCKIENIPAGSTSYSVIFENTADTNVTSTTTFTYSVVLPSGGAGAGK